MKEEKTKQGILYSLFEAIRDYSIILPFITFPFYTIIIIIRNIQLEKSGNFSLISGLILWCLGLFLNSIKFIELIKKEKKAE